MSLAQTDTYSIIACYSVSTFGSKCFQYKDEMQQVTISHSVK